TVQVMREHLVDLSEHRSRCLSGDIVDSADLVLTMTTDHAAEVTALRPDASGRTFTLSVFVRRALGLGPRQSDESFSAYVRRISETPESGVDGRRKDDDIADPIGQGMNVYAATAATLLDLVDRLVALLWGPPRL